jgi:tRNA-modifying protein YgfZ
MGDGQAGQASIVTQSVGGPLAGDRRDAVRSALAPDRPAPRFEDLTMSKSSVVHLVDRGVIAVRGPDAISFLDAIVTNDLAVLEHQPAVHAGLLTPQGKIIADFFCVRTADGVLLDCPAERVADLVKRLGMYKLRAKVEIADVSSEYAVTAAWPGSGAAGGFAFEDPRLPALGWRHLASVRPTDATVAEYAAHRVRLGVPEGGRDYVFGDTFAHEAMFDRFNGVSFTKGCYVGQEIVSRMQHRGTVRKRIVRVRSTGPLPATGTEITAEGVPVGRLGTVAGHIALALIRLDRADEATAKGVALMAGETAVVIDA